MLVTMIQPGTKLLLLVIVIGILSIQSLYCVVNNPDDNPLILTPLINRGNIEEARTAAEVHYEKFKGIRSYAAYFTVNERCNSNLFFWFFPSWTNYDKAPVILVLDGGPGASSMMNLFSEDGPLLLTPDFNLELRNFSWVQNHSVIYIDNPVGVGYSFTDECGYAHNETIIGSELYEALLQFFQLFPELQRNDFFATGISYAGKYVPAVSYAIHKHNPSAKLKINLRGLFIASGWSDPEHQIMYSDLLYRVGLLDSNSRNKMHELEKNCQSYISRQQWGKAHNQFSEILLDKNSLLKNASGFSSYYNYLEPYTTLDRLDLINQFVQFSDVRKAIHVSNSSFHMSEDEKVAPALNNDFVQSVAPWIRELLTHYKVLFFNGQLDIIVAYTTTVNFLRNLNFSGAEDYKTAIRHKWYVGSELAGYIKKAGNLTEVLVRNAHHAVMMDQPAWVLDLLTRFTYDLPYY